MRLKIAFSLEVNRRTLSIRTTAFGNHGIAARQGCIVKNVLVDSKKRCVRVSFSPAVNSASRVDKEIQKALNRMV